MSGCLQLTDAAFAPLRGIHALSAYGNCSATVRAASDFLRAQQEAAAE